jgi:hypothetical protein
VTGEINDRVSIDAGGDAADGPPAQQPCQGGGIEIHPAPADITATAVLLKERLRN